MGKQVKGQEMCTTKTRHFFSGNLKKAIKKALNYQGSLKS
jgi:hypothetical protein